MFQTIYLETEIKNHPRVLHILNSLQNFNLIEIKKYTDVFNRKNQNFRIQKEFGQTLILAQKKDNFIQEAPEKCKLGIPQSYYFSHLYNCPFDCEYCYLQGAYRSAHFVFFVNFEDYFQEIKKIDQSNPEQKYFFSGFDCDSIALEPLTGFAQEFIPFFEKLQFSTLELRTKSANLSFLKKNNSPQKTVLAWTLTPDLIQKNYEKKTATLKQRLNVLNQSLDLGWRVGIRFEPMLYVHNWRKVYGDFFDEIILKIDFSKIEDINLGTMHLPKEMYKKMRKILPESKLFSGPFELDELGEMRYFQSIDREMKELALGKLKKIIDERKIFVV